MLVLGLVTLYGCTGDEAPAKGAAPEAAAAVTWYVDCAAGDDAADGLTPETAFGTLARLAEVKLLPGESVRLRADTTCAGVLRLDGSGTADAPITVGAYGTGAAPIVDGTGEDAAVSLHDQSWITLSGLDIGGSRRWGVYVGSSAGAVEGITLADLDVHDVYGAEPDAKGTGLVVFTIEGEGAWFERVRVEHVQAWNTNQWSGIYLYGVAWRSGGTRSRDVRFHDNVVHDVGGDGIVAVGAEDVELDANLAYEVGQIDSDAVGTPNGIWTWDCHACLVQFNEAHHVRSPGVDGGAFDIDWDTVDNVVQYNDGYDNEGYCVAVFGASGSVTTGAVVRFNTCRDNGQHPDRAYQGDIFLYTWDGGSLGDVQIYNNTVVRTTPYGYPPLVVWSAPGAGSGVWNNLFVVEGDWIATVAGDLPLDHNLYWQKGAYDAAWFDTFADDWHDGLEAWQASGRDASSRWADPLLDGAAGKDGLRLLEGSPAIDEGEAVEDDGGCDAFGGALAGAPDIGAHAFGAAADAGCAPTE